MNPSLVYKTPLWKEAVMLLSACLFIAIGVACLYGSYLKGEWVGYLIGSLSLGFGLVGAVLSLSSNTALRLDAEGVFVQPHFFSKRTIPWRNIDRFEKSVQTFRQNDRFGVSEHKAAYLGIYLKQPREAGTAFNVVHAALSHIDPNNTKDPLIGRQQEGHIFIAELHLPGKIDTVLAEVRAYHTHITGGAVSYPPEEVLQSTKGSFKPSIYLIAMFIGIGILALLLLGTTVTGMNVEQLLERVF